MTGKKKLGQKRVSLLTSAQVSPAIGGNVLSDHYTILNFCGNAPVWLCDSGHDISVGATSALHGRMGGPQGKARALSGFIAMYKKI
ncbi:hypothetical protein PC1_0544 [Pectobacterium carotovorum subsp. carotovorum PC1]|uniref:Uncharacterized protein n=1 Tax=Pectobacterium carotovorum subsp. carotovorum (strain PC1) TaxID=561230 RepID=C6DKG2_PECCP|nr:hypothetical protein PC1_0544 [Pectobacterium carotovorum subsp. carotovorum PC1]